MRNCCILSPSASLTMLARVARASMNWLWARGKQAKVIFQNFGIKWPTHLWYGINLVSRFATFLLSTMWSTKKLQRHLNHMRRIPGWLVSLLYMPHILWHCLCNRNSTWLKYWFAGPWGILGLLLLHFQWYCQLHQSKASNATILHFLVLALLWRHPHPGREILRNLDHLATNPLGNRLCLGPWWPFTLQT